jgi:hypothetical protein
VRPRRPRALLRGPSTSPLDAQLVPVPLTWVIAFLEAAIFTLAGIAITLTSAVFFRHFLAFAWRMWLWGSVALIAGNFVLGVTLFPLVVLGIAGGPPRPHSVSYVIVTAMIVFGPLVITTLGILLGCVFGWREARDRAQLGV